ncbi:Mut7-C RNAse domain-containing protein [Bowmanella dokdonensis]|uniref:Mut7-C RNAse domain-containing protein n=1 Tax=Bowmanella dokdonensis TaxID=751969 RepID=A0A939IQ71_9ALTE|nr:Mut7-C RNAse domain-containing protein [Bowmanella dokdonensis]MBN7824312.1 hypothetical protein [Bowmanella dokdonensis]
MIRPAFLADAMLGRLCRWLRVLNLDTAYYPHLPDPQLVHLADREQRCLLTRDKALITGLQPDCSLLVLHDKPLDQLSQVVDHWSLSLPGQLFRRCLLCNHPLEPATPAQITNLAPSDSRNMIQDCWYCACCSRLYWPGSHTRRMTRQLSQVFPSLCNES